jgi:hypothetical protein
MSISADDISLVFSGGSENDNPYSSLGGPPSAVPLPQSGLNNLFDDVTAQESEDGLVDHRCFYIFNDGDDFVYDVRIWIVTEEEGGSDVEVGIEAKNEIQRLAMDGPEGGSLSLTYRSRTIVTTFDSDLAAWAIALQNSLNSLEDVNGNSILSGVTVRASNAGSTIYLDVTFEGMDAKRSHDTIIISTNNLTPSGTTASVATIQNGSPVNTEAPDLDLDTTTPSGVSFGSPADTAPIVVPKLEPGDGFPVWIRRTTEAGADPTSLDGATIRIRVNALPEGAA